MFAAAFPRHYQETCESSETDVKSYLLQIYETFRATTSNAGSYGSAKEFWHDSDSNFSCLTQICDANNQFYYVSCASNSAWPSLRG